MKKLLLLSLMSLGVAATTDLMAQQAKVDRNLIVEKDYSRPAKPAHMQPSAKKTRAGSRWYDPLVSTLDYRNGDTTGLDANSNSTFLWIDSTMRVRYTGAGGSYLGGIYLKSQAQIFDPFAKRFNDHTKLPAAYLGEMALRPSDSYTIDSVAVAGFYRRIATKPNVVDTLVVSVTYGNLSSSSNITSGGWTAAQAADLVNCYGTDTLWSGFLDYDWSGMGIKQAAGAANVITKKIILTQADSGGKYFVTNIGMNVPAANIAAMSVVFRSGDTWVPNVDTVADFNFFRMYYTEEIAGELALYEKRDWNSQHSLDNDTTGWGITYVPNYLYIGASGCSKTFTREQYWTLWKVSANTNGWVGTMDQYNKGIEANVYPNPAGSEATLSLNLTESAKNVSIEISNSLGQVIRTIPVGAVTAQNEKEVRLDLSGLSTGLYIYTISADGKKLSDKLMVK